ncbi:MAG: NTP transferase domain-containing protein [Oscillospiraceae bacterium]|nr:NTP transferase domain-containing protein [Oscillospiraceae bacterium]
MKIRAIIPAAGKGTRLSSHDHDEPKAMRLCGGRPLLETVLSNLDFIRPEDICIVVGYKKDRIIEYFGDSYCYAEQKEQLGTGHAVMVCEEQFRDFDGTVLVTFGDMPLFRREDLLAMCRRHEESGAACTLMTAENPELTMWARVIRDENGGFSAIVEGKDCTPEQAKTTELFSGVLAFDSRELFQTLPMVGRHNVQQEYYLTEVPELMLRRGKKVETFRIADGNSLRGVNTPEDLAICDALLTAAR